MRTWQPGWALPPPRNKVEVRHAGRLPCQVYDHQPHYQCYVLVHGHTNEEILECLARRARAGLSIVDPKNGTICRSGKGIVRKGVHFTQG